LDLGEGAVNLVDQDALGLDRFELVFAATHPGDNEYKPAVQQAHMLIAAKNTRGARQQITFPEIANQTLGTTKSSYWRHPMPAYLCRIV
jgi:hypothetical protein